VRSPPETCTGPGRRRCTRAAHVAGWYKYTPKFEEDLRLSVMVGVVLPVGGGAVDLVSFAGRWRAAFGKKDLVAWTAHSTAVPGCSHSYDTENRK
jgi:hypothetical protein